MDNNTEFKLTLETDELNITSIKSNVTVYDEYLKSFLKYAYLPLSEEILDDLSKQLKQECNVVKVTLDTDTLILLTPIDSEIKENSNLLKITTLLGEIVINRDILKFLVVT